MGMMMMLLLLLLLMRKGMRKKRVFTVLSLRVGHQMRVGEGEGVGGVKGLWVARWLRLRLRRVRSA
jgi:hypothetical protein